MGLVIEKGVPMGPLGYPCSVQTGQGEADPTNWSYFFVGRPPERNKFEKDDVTRTATGDISLLCLTRSGQALVLECIADGIHRVAETLSLLMRRFASIQAFHIAHVSILETRLTQRLTTR